MEIGVCSCCGRRTFIQNKTRNLCPECVYKRNHNGKSMAEVAREKSLKKPIKARNKAVKRKRKANTGEKAMFLDIWSKRPHFCNQCGKYLGEEPCSWMFSHNMAKGLSETYRLDPENIELLCFDCHFAKDMQGKEAFEKRKSCCENKI